MTVVEYLDEQGRSPFAEWFTDLDAVAAAKIRTAALRMELGNFSNAKSVGEGVHEYRVDFGPGYRIYFARDGQALILLLGGGTKRRQGADISTAKARWTDYKSRKERS